MPTDRFFSCPGCLAIWNPVHLSPFSIRILKMQCIRHKVLVNTKARESVGAALFCPSRQCQEKSAIGAWKQQA